MAYTEEQWRQMQRDIELECEKRHITAFWFGAFFGAVAGFVASFF